MWQEASSLFRSFQHQVAESKVYITKKKKKKIEGKHDKINLVKLQSKGISS